MSNMINLIIDGNNISYKAISVYAGIKGEKLFLLDKERNDFLRLLATGFISEMGRFKSVLGRVIVVADSRSWRYSIYPEYKGDRKRDENVNWQNYSLLVNEFYDIIAEHGIIISKSYGAEGDDLIYKWVNYLNKNDENVVIISMDRDLTQLTKFDNGVFTVQYDSTKRCKGLFGTQDFFDALDAKDSAGTIVDVFSINDFVNNEKDVAPEIISIFNNILKYTPLNIVNVDQFVFQKVLMGDRGDHIYSPYIKIKNKRKYGIGEKASEKIMATYNMTKKFKIKDLFDDDNIKRISELISTSMKLDSTLMSKVITGVKLNTNLMLLSERVMPDKVIDEMNLNIKNKISAQLNLSKIKNVDTLLNGTIKITKRKDTSLNLF